MKGNNAILSRKAEGRRQKAEGNSDSCSMQVTVGNKGLKPRRKQKRLQLGGDSDPAQLNLLPSALCLGVDRRFVPPSAAYGYKPYTAAVTEIDARFKRDGYARRSRVIVYHNYNSITTESPCQIHYHCWNICSDIRQERH